MVNDYSPQRIPTDKRRLLLSSLHAIVDVKNRFPSQIFKGIWSEFLFFDSDWMFDSQFIEIAKAMLEIERGECACVLELDANTDARENCFFIGRETSTSDYSSFLAERHRLHALGRFACLSASEQWCIYCETRNEMAVIGIRGDYFTKQRSIAAQAFKACPIKEAVSLPISYGFSARALSDEWRIELLKQYGEVGSTKTS
jgi:hypothetical protein